MTPSSRNLHLHADCLQLQAAVASRVFPLQARAAVQPPRNSILVIESGEANLRRDDTVETLSTAAVSFLPYKANGKLIVGAGTLCHLISFSNEMLTDAIGDEAESFSLRILVEKEITVTNCERSIFARLVPLVRGLHAEIRNSDESWMMTCAYLRLILLLIWRSLGAKTDESWTSGQAASILQRFRKLVEIHFREQKPITFYSSELGITPDRLHNICKRKLGRPPLALVHERVLHEAKLRLEKSGSSIEQIASVLGFRDSSYFRHFFKREAGVSPGKYRALASTDRVPHTIALSSGYSDWP